MEIDNGTVVALGLCIVFLVLVCLIIIITVLGAIMRKSNAKKEKAQSVPAAGSAPVASQTVIPNKAEFIAAVSAAVAEDTGTDISRIRIHKIEKV